jgi:hypothetical protein
MQRFRIRHANAKISADAVEAGPGLVFEEHDVRLPVTPTRKICRVLSPPPLRENMIILTKQKRRQR